MLCQALPLIFGAAPRPGQELNTLESQIQHVHLPRYIEALGKSRARCLRLSLSGCLRLDNSWARRVTRIVTPPHPPLPHATPRLHHPSRGPRPRCTAHVHLRGGDLLVQAARLADAIPAELEELELAVASCYTLSDEGTLP